MNESKRIIFGTMLGFMLFLSSAFSFYFLLAGIIGRRENILFSIGLMIFLASLLFLSFLLYDFVLWHFVFALLALAPILYFVEINIVTIIWSTFLVFLLWLVGIKMQKLAENQLKINVRQIFTVCEALLFGVLSLAVALFIYAGVPYESINLGTVIYESMGGLVDRAISWKFPFYVQNDNIEQIITGDYLYGKQESEIPNDIKTKLQDKFNWNGNNLPDILKVPEARIYIINEMIMQTPPGYFSDIQQNISGSIGMDFSMQETPKDIIVDYLNFTQEKLKNLLPAVLAVSAFLIYRVLGMLMGIISTLLATLMFSLMKTSKAVEIHVEKREKEVISF